jgi:hypothetical protein
MHERIIPCPIANHVGGAFLALGPSALIALVAFKNCSNVMGISANANGQFS